MVSTSLVRVLTFLVRVLTSLVMVSTSLGMVGTPEALLWGPQRRLLHRRATRDWKSESVTNLLTYQPTNLLTWVGARDTCVSKKSPLETYLQLCSFCDQTNASRQPLFSSIQSVLPPGWEYIYWDCNHYRRQHLPERALHLAENLWSSRSEIYYEEILVVSSTQSP